VIDRQRPHLDLEHLGLTAAGAERAGVLERGDRAVLGEAPLVSAPQLAGVQRDRGDLAL
jgi:hypothetical protein